MRAGEVVGSLIIGWSWKGLRGGFAPGHHGGTCLLISGRGRWYGNAITGFRSTAPINGSSIWRAKCGPTTNSMRASRGCCRSTRRSCALISMRPVHQPRTTQGAPSNYKKSAIVEPDDHGLGRSRGGLSTKIHALTDTDTCPVALSLTAGQAGDNPQLLPLVDGYLTDEQTTDTARGIQLLADKAYSHPSTRTALRRRGIKHTIPERDDQITRRKAKGSAGGRPPTFDAEIYKQRNTVERGFNRLKQRRGVATRYDKYALTFLGGVLLAASITRARTAIRN